MNDKYNLYIVMPNGERKTLDEFERKNYIKHKLLNQYWLPVSLYERNDNSFGICIEAKELINMAIFTEEELGITEPKPYGEYNEYDEETIRDNSRDDELPF